ncbi:MAG: glycosyltransferase [Mucilaginibacter sp.]|nr:glycosyltransferase [Mucilaginibacter sp.]
MRLLITNTYYFPAFDGGAEISVKLLAEGLVKAGHQIFVLTTGKETKIYRVNGVIVISLKQRNIFNSYKKGSVPVVLKMFWHMIDSCNPFYHFQIRSILKRLKPNVVHTNNVQGFSPFLWLTVKSQRIPLVHSMRDYYMLCFKCNMFNSGQQNCDKLCTACKVTHTVKRNFFKYPDLFIGISDFILKKYKSYVPISSEKSTLIYNAVDTKKLEEAKPLGDKIRFGYIGRIAKDKGVEYMVNELSQLTEDQKSRFSVTLAGNGDIDFVEELKSKLKGIDHTFLGVAKPADFYTAIDVLLVPALWNEPFGRIVIESLSFNVPVCQSDRGGLKELYDDQTSWLFTPEAGNLTKAIHEILDNKDQIAVKSANCLNDTGKFSADRYVNDHIKVYKKLTSNYKPEYSKAGNFPALLTKTD